MLALAFAFGLIANPSITLRDIDGVNRQPLRGSPASVLFFITHDCPISNAYAHEIGRICSEYGPKGAACTLVYVDPALSEEAAQIHARDYGHAGYAKVIDRRHELVKATGATITPEAVVVAG